MRKRSNQRPDKVGTFGRDPLDLVLLREAVFGLGYSADPDAPSGQADGR
jgi:hypothetical protein